MSFLGAIDLKIKADATKIVSVELKPEREVHVETLFIGKSPEEVLGLIPDLFTLCPDSQRAAAAVAFELAKTGHPDQKLIAISRFFNHLEIINEGIRFFALQCADDAYRADKIKAVAQVGSLIAQMKKLAWKGQPFPNEALWQQLRSTVSFLLLDGFPVDWQQDLLNGTINPTEASLSVFFNILSNYREIGWCDAPILAMQPTYLLESLKEEGAWSKTPWKVQVPYLTGALSVMRDNSLVKTLLSQEGNTMYVRFVARFVEILSAVDRIRVPTTMIEAMEIEKRLAVCGVQNSRGFLLHSVKLSGDAKKIENYSILTPTEINVTQSPWFKDTLKKIRVNYAEHLKKVTQFVTLSFDPCAQYRIEIENA